jgi:hypothetical protein
MYRVRKAGCRKGVFRPCLLENTISMPAAELSRLQAQISAISTQFNEPRIFLRSLLTLMELYSNQHYKPGNLSRIKHLVPEYRLPAPVIQQLTSSLSTLTSDYPIPAMQIMDSLWQAKHFEARLMAAIMLGNLPSQPIEPAMDRINKWVNPIEDKDLINALLNSANRLFKAEKMGGWLDQIKAWLGYDNEGMVKIGLQAIHVILNDQNFVNSEKIFPLLEPFFLHPNLSFQKELLHIVELLADHSEMEITSFLRSILMHTNEAEVIRFVRRCLPLLEQDSQTLLKALMIVKK